MRKSIIILFIIWMLIPIMGLKFFEPKSKVPELEPFEKVNKAVELYCADLSDSLIEEILMNKLLRNRALNCRDKSSVKCAPKWIMLDTHDVILSILKDQWDKNCDYS